MNSDEEASACGREHRYRNTTVFSTAVSLLENKCLDPWAKTLGLLLISESRPLPFPGIVLGVAASNMSMIFGQRQDNTSCRDSQRSSPPSKLSSWLVRLG